MRFALTLRRFQVLARIPHRLLLTLKQRNQNGFRRMLSAGSIIMTVGMLRRPERDGFRLTILERFRLVTTFGFYSDLRFDIRLPMRGIILRGGIRGGGAMRLR